MANDIIFGPRVGGVTSGSAVVKAAVGKDAAAELILSQSSTLSNPERFNPTAISASAEMKVVALALTNLITDK